MAVEKNLDLSKFVSREGRTIQHGDLVGMHWNAHQDCYSIVSMKSRNTVGLVLGYADSATLVDCTVKIDKSKQKKVWNTGTKDRHAFIVGRIESLNGDALEKNLYYSPKQRLESFVDKEVFKSGKVEYLEFMKSVSLNSHNNTYPVVTYK
ncbi:hypothetical protein [Peribacillus asahii]|uniref:hypothetical protein n=1 Tax=Peribacillus asahii TaxID=228899 RepID=UPI00381D8E06